MAINQRESDRRSGYGPARPHWEKRSQAAQAEEIERTPLRRVAEAVDQANVICFLASSDADFVTGITIDVTGGV